MSAPQGRANPSPAYARTAAASLSSEQVQAIMAQREESYKQTRAVRYPTLQKGDSEELKAFGHLEESIALLSRFGMRGSIVSIIAVGHKLQAGRFDSFLQHVILSRQKTMTMADVPALSTGIASWADAYRNSFASHSEDYKALLEALRIRWAPIGPQPVSETPASRRALEGYLMRTGQTAIPEAGSTINLRKSGAATAPLWTAAPAPPKARPQGHIQMHSHWARTYFPPRQ